MAPYILVVSGSGNGLVPDDTKPLPGPMLTYQWDSLWYSHKTSFTTSAQDSNLKKMSFKNALLKIASAFFWEQWVNTNVRCVHSNLVAVSMMAKSVLYICIIGTGPVPAVVLFTLLHDRCWLINGTLYGTHIRPVSQQALKVATEKKKRVSKMHF